MLFFKKLSLVAIFSIVPVLAVPTLKITDVTNAATATAVDDIVLDLNSLIPGSLIYSGTVGQWTVNVVTGSSKPIVGSALNPILSISSTNVYSGVGAGELLIEFIDDFFTGSPSQLRLDTSASNTPFSITSGAEYIASNAITFGGGLADPTSISETSGGPFTGTFSDVRVADLGFTDSQYSLRSVARLTASGPTTGTFDLRLQAVPEPGFYGALALGLSGLFAAVARRRRSSNV